MPQDIALLLLGLHLLSNGLAQDDVSGRKNAPRTVLLTPEDVSALRKNRSRFASLLKQCAAKLDYKAVSTVVFAPDPHYTSTGVSTSANNAKQLAADARAAYRAALCYLVSGDERYAVCTQRILDAWAGTLKKVANKQGRADINFNFPLMIIAASWVRGAAKWNSTLFDTFLPTTILPNSEAKSPNNHGFWGVFLEAAAGAYLGDNRILSAARARWEALIRESVDSEGTMPHEVQRSDTNNWIGGPTKGIKGMAYTHYALYPASMAAKIFADQGQPVWNTREGQRFKAAFARTAAWTLHPETFPYYASNHGKLIEVRNAAYFVLLVKPYPNKDAEVVLKQSDLGLNGLLLLELFGQ